MREPAVGEGVELGGLFVDLELGAGIGVGGGAGRDPVVVEVDRDRGDAAALAAARDVEAREARLVGIEEEVIEVPRRAYVEADTAADRRVVDLAPRVVLAGARGDHGDER